MSSNEPILELIYLSCISVIGFICLTFPRKNKLTESGELKYDGCHIIRIFTTMATGFFSLLFTLIAISESTNGSLDKETGVRTYLKFQFHWPLYFFILFTLHVYATFELLKTSWATQRRQSIVQMIKRYGGSKDFTLARLDKFCKKYDLSIFPIIHFEKCLKDVESKSECGGPSTAMTYLETDMTLYDEMNKVNAIVASSCSNHSRFKALDMKIWC